MHPTTHFLTLVFLLVSTSALADWPTVGGNSQRNGKSGVVGPAQPDLLWDGTSESALFGGQCFIDGDRMATMRFQSVSVSPIVGFDLETGDELWTRDFPGANSRSVPRGMRDGWRTRERTL